MEGLDFEIIYTISLIATSITCFLFGLLAGAAIGRLGIEKQMRNLVDMYNKKEPNE